MATGAESPPIDYVLFLIVTLTQVWCLLYVLYSMGVNHGGTGGRVPPEFGAGGR